MQTKSKLYDDQLKNENSLQLLSVKKFLWEENRSLLSIQNKLEEKFNVDRIFAKLLSIRDVTVDNYSNFIDPKLKNILPDPKTIDEMSLATDKIVDVILKKKKIGLFGDYDVDGTSSTALFGNYLNDIGARFEFYIPDRLKEGYGPNIEAFKELKKKSCEIIVTLDCGTTSISAINQVAKENVDVIVVDHHLQDLALPSAFAIVNPNKNKDSSNLNNLCATGVVFFLIISINRELKRRSFFVDKSPNLLKYLDLVALGTVCDVVKLDLVNRAFVKQGLKICNGSKNLGLNSLIENSGIDDQINEYHLGYLIGPRINAGGRVGDSSMGVKLLLEKKQSLSSIFATKLGECNNVRKKVEKEVEISAIKEVDPSDSGIICVSSKDWHLGVIGIVASKLTERFSRPSIVISESDKICKASCRSVSNFNIGELIFRAVEDGILLSGGGHKMAGGFSIKKSNIEKFKKYILKKFDSTKSNVIKFYDSELRISSISNDFYYLIDRLSPFGPGNPRPKFLLRDCYIRYTKLVGNNHLSCFVEDIYGNRVKGISFGAYDTSLGTLIENKGATGVCLIVSVRMNNWKGMKKTELQIEDMLKI